MKPKKILLNLTQGQREHVKMLTGFGPARLHIEIAPKAEVPFGKPWSTKMASTAVRLTDDQKDQIKEELGVSYDYLKLSKADVDVWRKG